MISIQTFFLCETTENIVGSVCDARKVPISEVGPTNGTYPIIGDMPFVMLLYKDTGKRQRFDVSFRLEDAETGKLVVEYGDQEEGNLSFPAKHSFVTLRGTIELRLPLPGIYRLTVVLVERPSGDGTVYHYNLRAMEKIKEPFHIEYINPTVN